MQINRLFEIVYLLLNKGSMTADEALLQRAKLVPLCVLYHKV